MRKHGYDSQVGWGAQGAGRPMEKLIAMQEGPCQPTTPTFAAIPSSHFISCSTNRGGKVSHVVTLMTMILTLIEPETFAQSDYQLYYGKPWAQDQVTGRRNLLREDA